MPNLIKIGLPNGSVLEQSVIYESLPLFCNSCHALGHLAVNCGKQAALNSRGKGKATKVASHPTEGTSSLQGPLVGQVHADMNGIRMEPRDNEVDPSPEGWVQVAGKSKSTAERRPLERDSLPPLLRSYDQALKIQNGMRADSSYVDSANGTAAPSNLRRAAEDSVDRGKSIVTPLDLPSDVMETRNAKKIKKGAKGSLAPQAFP